MSEFIDASKTIKNLARQYRHMIVAAEALEKIGLLENAEKEGQERLEQVRTQVHQAEKELQEVKAVVADANQTAERLLSEAKAGAAYVKQSAEQEARDLKTEATAAADSIKTTAETKANELLKKANDELTVIEEQTSFARANLTATEERIRERQMELDKINEGLARAREEARKIAG